MAELNRSEEFEGPRVTVSMGYTKNMGNFESLRLDIGLEASGRPGENPNVIYGRVKDWVETTFLKEFAELEASVEEAKK